MRKAFVLAGLLLTLFATQAPAQLHYDPYFALPAMAASKGALAGLDCADLSSLGDVSDLFGMARYSLTDQIEVGARLTSGLLNDFRDTFSTVVIGGKYGLTPQSAVTAAFLLPIGDAEDPGLSVGYMQTFPYQDKIQINGWARAGFLKGYAYKGVVLDLLVEPTMAINPQITGFLALLAHTNTDNIGDWLGIDLWPNIDYKLKENVTINAGITLGLAGDFKQNDLGVRGAWIVNLK